jgi:hypothetical protein
MSGRKIISKEALMQTEEVFIFKEEKISRNDLPGLKDRVMEGNTGGIGDKVYKAIGPP